MPDSLYLPAILVLGLVAGVLGGMLGVGGSIVMIPGLTFLLGFNQHLYQAAAMIANVVVSIPATFRHRRAGAIVPAALKWMLPAAVVCILLGVAVSNLPIFTGRDGAIWLGRILAIFLVYVIALNVHRLTTGTRSGDPESRTPTVTPGRSGAVGSVMGLIAGLLGVGGGAIAVPLQQVWLRLPLRNCIANSSAVICVSAALGALYKNATLAGHVDIATGDPLDWRQSLILALMLAPTAWIGGRIGASLTHRLPLRQVRVAFILLMLISAWKMAALPWP